MKKAPDVPRVPALSLRDMIHAWYMTVDLPTVAGHKMHWQATHVRENERHAASALEHVLDDMTVRGLPLDVKLGAARTIETYIRATHPSAVAHVDPTAASLREEHATARVNPLQMRAMNIHAMPDLDLDRLDAFLGEQEDATRAYREQIKQVKAQRVLGRAAARQQLAFA